MLGVAGVASKAQESVLQPAALQVAIEGLPHMSGQLLAGIGQVFGKSRVMPLDDLVEQCLFGSVALVQTARPSAACVMPNGRIAGSGHTVSRSMARYRVGNRPPLEIQAMKSSSRW